MNLATSRSQNGQHVKCVCIASPQNGQNVNNYKSLNWEQSLETAKLNRTVEWTNVVSISQSPKSIYRSCLFLMFAHATLILLCIASYSLLCIELQFVVLRRDIVGYWITLLCFTRNFVPNWERFCCVLRNILLCTLRNFVVYWNLFWWMECVLDIFMHWLFHLCIARMGHRNYSRNTKEILITINPHCSLEIGYNINQ